jgi:EF hand
MRNARNLLIGTAAALLPLVAANAQKPPEPPGSTPEATFKSLDKDSDGRISKAEAEGNTRVQSEFSRLDVNRDGFIDRNEVDQANNARTPEHH